VSGRLIAAALSNPFPIRCSPYLVPLNVWQQDEGGAGGAAACVNRPDTKYRFVKSPIFGSASRAITSYRPKSLITIQAETTAGEDFW